MSIAKYLKLAAVTAALIYGGQGVALASPTLVKKASYRSGLIDSYQYQAGDVQMFASPILYNANLISQDYSISLPAVSGSSSGYPLVMGNTRAFAKFYGSPMGKFAVPTITGTSVDQRFTMGDNTMLYYKDHRGTWKVGPANQFGIAPYSSGTQGAHGASLAAITNVDAIAALNNAAEIYAGHYILTKNNELHELTLSWSAGKVQSVISRLVMSDVQHLRAGSDSVILAITTDNKLYRLVKDLQPVLIGSIHASLVEAAKNTATFVQARNQVWVNDAGTVKTINGELVRQFRAYSARIPSLVNDDETNVYLDNNNKTKWGMYVPYKLAHFVHNNWVTFNANGGDDVPNAAVVAYLSGTTLKIGTGTSTQSATFTVSPREFSIPSAPAFGKLIDVGGGSEMAMDKDAFLSHADGNIQLTTRVSATRRLNYIKVNFERGAMLIPVIAKYDASKPADKVVIEPVTVNGHVVYYAIESLQTLPTEYSVDPYYGGFTNAARNSVCTILSYDRTESPGDGMQPVSNPALSSYKFFSQFPSFKIEHQARLTTCVSRNDIQQGVNENLFFFNAHAGNWTVHSLDRNLGGLVEGIRQLDVRWYDTAVMSVSVASQNEAMVAPYTVIGLNEGGQPYVRGLISSSSIGAPINATAPNVYVGVRENLVLDTGTLYLEKASASKGRYYDKIVATWGSNGTRFALTPKRCNKLGDSCTATGEKRAVSGEGFEHTIAQGLDQSINHASPYRMFYDVEATRSLRLYPWENSLDSELILEQLAATTSGGYVSSPPTSTSAYLATSSNTEFGLLTVTADDPDESNEYRFEIVTQGSHGMASVDAQGRMRYSAGNYYGTDSFTYRLFDGPNSIIGTATVEISCPAPEIVKVTPPSSFKPWEANVLNIQYRANACNGPQLEAKITAGTPSVPTLDRYTKVASVINASGTNLGALSFADPDPGNFIVKIELSSPLVAGNTVQVSNSYSVPAYGPAQLAISNNLPNEDQLVTASVHFPGGDCTMYATEAEAKTHFGCFVQWDDLLLGPTLGESGGKATIRGYGPLGGPHQFIANIQKVDSTRTPRLVSSLASSLTVTPGAAIEFDNPVFEAGQRQFLDYISFAPVPRETNNCVLTTSMDQAAAEANAGKRVCVLQYTELPAGLAMVGDGSTRVKGRILGSATAANVAYTVSKFYSNRPMAVAMSSEFTIPVTPTVFNGAVTFDRPEYARGLQVATATAGITGQPTCTMTNSLTEAKASYTKTTPLVCYGEWTNLPAWLTNKAGTKLIATGTVPGEPGEYPVAYSLYMVDDKDQRALMGTYTGNLKVAEISDIGLTIHPSGLQLLNQAGETIYAATQTGKIGSFSIQSGLFTTVRTTITVGSNMPMVISNIKNGDTRDLTVSGTNAPAWEVRVANLKAEYEGIADTSKTTNRQIKVAQLPPVSSMTAVIERPTTTLVDTQPFTLFGAVGIPAGFSTVNYSETSQGKWTAYLASQEPDGLLPISGTAQMISGGRFRFDDLSYQDVIGRNVVLVAESLPPSDIVLSEPLRIVSSVIRLDFVSGEAIVGNLFIDKSRGEAPLTTRLSVQIPQQSAQNVGMVTWESSLDDGGTWESLSGLLGAAVAHTFTDGGKYLVRARITNKHSGAVSFTNPVSISVTQGLRLGFSGNTKQIPGQPLEVVLDVQKPMGGTIPYDVEWTVNTAAGQQQSFSNVDRLVLESDTPLSYEINVKAKASHMDANDPTSWTSAKRLVSFGWPQPLRLSTSGLKRIEVGSPLAITGKITAKDAATDFGLTLKSQWELPEGASTSDPLDGATINITFDPNVYVDGQMADVIYRAWAEGAREKTETTLAHRVQLTKYEFANFVLTKKSETAVAPAYLRLQIEPANAVERRKIGSQKMSYAWTVPEADGLVARASGNALTLTAQAPGEYPVTATVTDQRGNSQELSYVLNVAEPSGHVVSLGLREGLKFNRAPMTYTLRPVVTGGHPSDKITQFELLVNDESIQVSAGNRPPKSVVIANPGDHTIKLQVRSLMDKTSSATERVTVNPNRPPQCESLAVVWDRKGTAASVTSRCVDVDGRIKGYRWFLNGVLQEKRTSNRISLGQELIGSSAEVRFEAFDDSGDVTEQTVTLTPPGMSVK